MTLDALRALALSLGNQKWCRYWIWWSYPCTDPWEMAISCVEFRTDDHGTRARSVEIPDLLKEGFREERRDKLIFYVVARTNEDGTPFRSEGA